MSGPTVYFIENLTLWTWFLSVLPRLVWARLRDRGPIKQVHVFDGSRLNISLAKATGGILGVAIAKLNFEIVEVRDAADLPIRQRVIYQDLARIQQYALDEQPFDQLEQRGILKGRMPTYLAKQIVATDASDRSSVWRAITVIQVCLWKVRSQYNGPRPHLFLERRPWLSAVQRYAREEEIAIVPVRPRAKVRSYLRQWLPPGIIDILRSIRTRLHSPIWKEWSPAQESRGHERIDVESLAPPDVQTSSGKETWASQKSDGARDGPKVALDFFGQLNLDFPERHSDLFYWQQSTLLASDILVAFSIPRDPLDQKKLSELREHGLATVTLHPGASTVQEVPRFNHRRPAGMALKGLTGSQAAWTESNVAKYRQLKEYWSDFAESYNIKVYATWTKYDASHCAVADGVQAAGGVTAVYQRAYEAEPSPEITTNADIVFGFSPSVADVERRSNSVIRHHVSVGYLGDHRFSLLREQARSVRESLQENGAKRVLAYFDENSSADARWLLGHRITRENYSFLLEKVLENPWLGLVLKPKVPANLLSRLGPVANLLERALATGRCVVYQSGILLASHPPVAAGLSADIAIHGHLCAATAGVESALAGVPTLLMNRERWPESPLSRLEQGRVVFSDWDDLWEACQKNWSTSEGDPGLGDWSSMLDEFDPFRDGRAAERMGDYIKSLLVGFKQGMDREQAMAEAAEQYCAVWGRDKITEVLPIGAPDRVAVPPEPAGHR